MEKRITLYDEDFLSTTLDLIKEYENSEKRYDKLIRDITPFWKRDIFSKTYKWILDIE